MQTQDSNSRLNVKNLLITRINKILKHHTLNMCPMALAYAFFTVVFLSLMPFKSVPRILPMIKQTSQCMKLYLHMSHLVTLSQLSQKVWKQDKTRWISKISWNPRRTLQPILEFQLTLKLWISKNLEKIKEPSVSQYGRFKCKSNVKMFLKTKRISICRFLKSRVILTILNFS